MKQRRWPGLIAALHISGCATLQNDLAPVRDAWLGATYEEVVTRWGTPARSTSFSDGRLVYTWASQGVAQRGSIWPSIGLSAGSGFGVGIGVGVTAGASREVTVSCERTLIFKDGLVAEQTWQGPDDFCSTFRRR
jgi:hypothetical protein